MNFDTVSQPTLALVPATPTPSDTQAPASRAAPRQLTPREIGAFVTVTQFSGATTIDYAVAR